MILRTSSLDSGTYPLSWCSYGLRSYCIFDSVCDYHENDRGTDEKIPHGKLYCESTSNDSGISLERAEDMKAKYKKVSESQTEQTYLMRPTY